MAVRFEGGAVGTIAALVRAARSRLPRPARRCAALDASVELGLGDDLVVLTRGQRRHALVEERRTFAEPTVAGYGAGGRAAVADLIGAIRDGRATEAPIDALVRALEVIDAAYESARTSRHVSVPRG